MPGIDNDQQNRIKHFKLTQVSSQGLIRKKKSTYRQTVIIPFNYCVCKPISKIKLQIQTGFLNQILYSTYSTEYFLLDSLITMLGIIYSSNSFMVKVLVYGCHLWILRICTLQSHSQTFCYPLNVLAILMLCHILNLVKTWQLIPTYSNHVMEAIVSSSSFKKCNLNRHDIMKLVNEYHRHSQYSIT